MVDVEHQDRERPAVTAGALDFLMQAFFEFAPVIEAGQAVTHGQLLQLVPVRQQPLGHGVEFQREPTDFILVIQRQTIGKILVGEVRHAFLEFTQRQQHGTCQPRGAGQGDQQAQPHRG
jgi:hypothetical protein